MDDFTRGYTKGVAEIEAEAERFREALQAIVDLPADRVGLPTAQAIAAKALQP